MTAASEVDRIADVLYSAAAAARRRYGSTAWSDVNRAMAQAVIDDRQRELERQKAEILALRAALTDPNHVAGNIDMKYHDVIDAMAAAYRGCDPDVSFLSRTGLVDAANALLAVVAKRQRELIGIEPAGCPIPGACVMASRYLVPGSCSDAVAEPIGIGMTDKHA